MVIEIITKIPLINSKESYKISEILKRKVERRFLHLLVSNLPLFILSLLGKPFENVDISISNVSGPRDTLYINACKV